MICISKSVIVYSFVFLRNARDNSNLFFFSFGRILQNLTTISNSLFFNEFFF